MPPIGYKRPSCIDYTNIRSDETLSEIWYLMRSHLQNISPGLFRCLRNEGFPCDFHNSMPDSLRVGFLLGGNLLSSFFLGI